jgi:predicted membrane channel-forming protein YqfA (hemolysin III family)
VQGRLASGSQTPVSVGRRSCINPQNDIWMIMEYLLFVVLAFVCLGTSFYLAGKKVHEWVELGLYLVYAVIGVVVWFILVVGMHFIFFT